MADLRTVNKLLAGSVGGAAQVLVGQPLDAIKTRAQVAPRGMLSPLLGIAGVNSLLFASYGLAKQVVTPFGELSLPQTALAGAMAGVLNVVLASPGHVSAPHSITEEYQEIRCSFCSPVFETARFSPDPTALLHQVQIFPEQGSAEGLDQ
ncbi:hypothetical protein BJ322DRAFT_1078038 [Thelephora terrestris]|uniref:Uncharacterized protein n=1 Tax=Thelephora terrestris TaxID=56493 RepID=A0A9P6H8J7_9AGAM|nr:hypothetical protein BJ322DRAFT_1078038 [Thelephora terrestris]